MSNNNAEKGNSEGKSRGLGKKHDNIGDDDMIIYGTNKDDTIFGLDGVNTISGRQGDDKIVGEEEELIFSNIAGTVMIPIVPVFGGDFLYGDQGSDQIYGDLVNLSYIVEAGPNSSQVLVVSPISLGDDKLYGNQGKDTLIGDVGDVLLSAKASDATTAPADATLGIIDFTIDLIMGADKLYGGQGKDSLYGDVERLTVFLQGGSSNYLGAAPNTGAIANLLATAIMGDDTLDGGNGDDLIVGDIGTLRTEALAGTDSTLTFGVGGAAITNNTYTFGYDILTGGNGNDSIYGDVQHLEIIGVGGETFSIDDGPSGYAEPFVDGRFDFGIDNLFGDNGGDYLVGDVGELSISLTGGTDNTNSSFGGGTSANFGVGVFFGAPRDFFSFGNDTIDGGQGNDVLIGDVETFHIALQGGINAGETMWLLSAAASFQETIITMGIDTLIGGSGNDSLYGDLANFSLLIEDGSGFGTDAWTNNLVFEFGNDVLIGGSGDDVLVGDIADVSQVGSYLNSDLAPAGPLSFPAPNSLIFGNDIFQFSLGGMNGNDIIKDMNVGADDTDTCFVTNTDDTLKFTDVSDVVDIGTLDYQDVDAVSTFSDSGGHVLMSFAGGSILFENISWDGQDSVLDITSSIIVE